MKAFSIVPLVDFGISSMYIDGAVAYSMAKSLGKPSRGSDLLPGALGRSAPL